MIYGFHPFEEFALDVGKNLRKSNFQGVETIRYTPKSIGEDYQILSSMEHIRKSAEGRKELRSYIDRTYGRVGSIIELHDCPAPVITHASISFSAWNLKLKGALEEFCKNLKCHGYFVYAIGYTPRSNLSYHSADIEYFPNGARDRSVLKKKDGLFILETLVRQLKNNYLSRSRSTFTLS